MKIEIQIPDELYARYELQGRSRDVSVKRELADRLQMFVDAPPKDRVLVVRAPARRELEDLLNCSLQGDDDLTTRVGRLAALSIGEIKLAFSPGQLTELALRAKKNNRSIEQELQIAVKSVQSLVFDRV